MTGRPSAAPHRPEQATEGSAAAELQGPGSQVWRINREAVLLGAGPAALLQQIAHPLVAEGVAAHSAYRTDPFGRLRRTLRTTLDLVFGDPTTRDHAIRRLNGVHARVRGDVLDPDARRATAASSYRALDPQLLLWVQATLVVTAARAYAAWITPLSADDHERFWQGSRLLGADLGIPASVAPASWSGLLAWYEAMLEPGGPVRVTPTARQLALSILRPPLPFLPGQAVDLLMLPGLAFVPPRLRDEYGIHWSPARASLAGVAAAGLRTWVTLMPASWRALPPARAAERRER